MTSIIFEKFTLAYISFLKDALQRNKKELVKAVNNKDKDLEGKIERALERGGLPLDMTPESVREAILNEDPFATAMFAINPGRQGLSETFQISYASEKYGISLKKSTNLYVLKAGSILKGKPKHLAESAYAPKSLDFTTVINEVDFKVTAKITNCNFGDKKMSGGNQTSIDKEMRLTAEAFDAHLKNNPNAGYEFIMLLDGTFFDKEARKKIQAITNNPKIHVVSSDELKDVKTFNNIRSKK